MAEAFSGWLALDKLMSLLVSLVRESRDESRYLFTNVVQPTYDALSAVHQDYSISYNGYATILEEYSGTDGCPMLFTKLKRDMAASATARARTVVFTERCRNRRLTPFKRSVVSYLRGPMPRGDRFANAPRIGLLAELHGILRPGVVRTSGDADRMRRKALRSIDRCTGVLRRRFEAASTEYQSLETLLRV